MEIKKNIEGVVYKKLVEYALKKCDVISVTYRPDQHEEETDKDIKVILKGENCSKEDVVNNYCDKYIGEIFEKYKYNNQIFAEDYQTLCEKYNDEEVDYKYYIEFKNDVDRQKEIIKDYKKYGLNISFENITFKDYKIFFENNSRLDNIYDLIGDIVYNDAIEKWINKYKNSIIHEKKSVTNEDEKELIISITYYLKITEELKRDILSRNSIFDWRFPLSIEDIEFYKDGYRWLFSVAHERMLSIYCKNKKEFNYLKSIGVKFVEKEFMPVEKEKIRYVNYKDSKSSVKYVL